MAAPLVPVDLPGAAGAIQTAVLAGKATQTQLIDELAANYDQYHEYLADELDRLGGRPEPDAFVGRYDAFLQAATRFDHLVRAEVVMRECAASRRPDIRQLVWPRHVVPIVDEQHRLVSVVTRMANPQHASRAPQNWKPAPMPWRSS